MSAIIGRAAFRAARPAQLRAIRPRFSSTTVGAAGNEHDQKAGKEVLKKGAKRDPELYILFAIMSGVFGLAGWHFSRSPTSASSEQKVAKVPHSESWKTGSSAAYQYHPGGDPSKGKKDAPSPLNTVIVPNVNLPKDLHDQFNKYGKPGY
ncbi:hypothetical protein E2P81_ATG09631 [Venturia nashicola]|uniref:Uncharacterized protein n=1 Tax=Venturia nashicola TaxID=86259 RepID=A0A4Z1P5H7_9PEZI|nr:hypothetical protein E6O75_ATG09842 [Venturia nashicola]TLD25974.1 hypothetical protein E2P81_ATG09631 [Venturia nashicola]